MATYHVGLNPDAPYDVIHLAGFEIPKWTERVEGYGASTKRDRIQGVYLDLDDEQVERIKTASTRKVFRFAGKPSKRGHRRALLIDKAGSGFTRTGQPGAGKPSKPYKPQPDDKDVAAFVYVRKSEHNLAKAETFESLADTPAKAGGKKAS